MVRVPSNPVDGHVMRFVSVEERTRVGFGTHVHLALFRANQKHMILLVMEIESCPAACMYVM